MSKSVVFHFGKKIFGILHWLIASIRRLLCCWRRRVYEPDILPFSVKSQQNDGAFLENWDSWESNKMKKKSIVETQIEEYRQRLTSELAAPPEEENEPVPDPDFFLDMEPEYKRTKKILLKTKAPQSPTNKFAVQADNLAIVDSFNTSELGVLNEYDDRGISWDVDEETLDVDSVLKEAKKKERMERVEKHKQKKYEKVKQHNPLSGGKQLEAVKLS